MHQHFKIPDATFSLSHVIGFTDVGAVVDQGWLGYVVHMTSGAEFRAAFVSAEEAKASYEKLKKALGIYDHSYSLEELA
jgi:hypothetical protein